MKKDKELTEFFNGYAEQMLPKDGEAFMKRLRKNMDQLPVPSAFNEMEAELSKEYAQWMLEKLKKDYKQQKRDRVFAGCLIAVFMLALMGGIQALKVADGNLLLMAGVWGIAALISAGCSWGITFLMRW